MNNSNWTGRTPRTMHEAFGPYASLDCKKSNSNTHLFIAAALMTLAIIYMLIF
jgi:hypothetical protein